MWLFTRYGFYSAVCARKNNGKKGSPINPDRIMVRARIKSHLQALKSRFHELLRRTKIEDTYGTDYRFRIFIPKRRWATIVAEIVLEMTWDNFKSEVARFQPQNDGGYEHSLHSVWGTMSHLQPTRPYYNPQAMIEEEFSYEDLFDDPRPVQQYRTIPCTSDPGDGSVYTCEDWNCPAHGERNQRLAEVEEKENEQDEDDTEE
jgi:hypothetical protein